MTNESISIPAEIQSEMSLLGGCLLSINWVNEVVPRISSSDFFSPENRHIFDLIKDMYNSDSEVTFQKIEAKICLKTCPLTHLIDILSLGNTSYECKDLIDAIQDASKKRNLQRIAQAFIQDTCSKERSSQQILSSVEEQLFSLSEGIQQQVLQPLKEIIDKPIPFLQELQKRQDLFHQGISAFRGTPTGYYDLDTMMKGLSPGHLTIIGARPGVGKTTFALNLVESIVLKYHTPILFFSLEMPSQELVSKLICQHAEISFSRFADGNLTGDEFQKLNVSYHTFLDKTIIIDDQSSLLIDQFRARALRAKRVYGIKVIFVDYVQLMRSNSKGTDVRHLEIADISRRLKQTAKELELPIIALAQLNRELEKRQDKKPYLSDLRESGSLEADADQVILLHRAEMFDPYDQPGLIQLYLAKNRFGPTGKILLAFTKDTGAIKNYASIEKQS